MPQRSDFERIRPFFICIGMASYYLFMENNTEFLTRMKDKEPELIIKLVRCVLSAIKRRKNAIDVFEITFRDHSNLLFSIDKTQYYECLQNYMSKLVELEEYELCAEIVKVNAKQPKRITYRYPTSKNQIDENSPQETDSIP